MPRWAGCGQHVRLYGGDFDHSPILASAAAAVAHGAVEAFSVFDVGS